MENTEEKTFEELDREFAATRPLYEEFGKSLESVLGLLLKAEKIEHLRIEGRTKDRDTFSEKIRRADKAGKYKSIEDMTDLCGIRVVGLYLMDVERVCSVIEANFEMDWANTVDKSKELPSNQFGYTSIQYIVSYSHSRLKLPEFAQFRGLKAEIQVRTVLQHAWAVLDRKYQYQSKEEIPSQVRRKFSRISAFLEAADDGFVEFERERNTIRAKYEQDMIAERYGAVINREVLDAFLRNSKSVKELADIASSVGVRLKESDRIPAGTLSRLQTMLNSIDVRTIDDLQKFLVLELPRAGEKFRSFIQHFGGQNTPSSKAYLMLVFLSLVSGNKGEIALSHSGLGPNSVHAIATTRASLNL
jgi:putative GTP pyrophosphokinase